MAETEIEKEIHEYIDAKKTSISSERDRLAVIHPDLLLIMKKVKIE